MPSPNPEPLDEGFFNNMSQEAPYTNTTETQNIQTSGSTKMKTIACILCRRRKLRCDGARPECSTCKRLSHDCAYDEVRKKSGPKRGYVKLLEQRLQQVETLLKSKHPQDHTRDANLPDPTSAYVASTMQYTLPTMSEVHNMLDTCQETAQHPFKSGSIPLQQPCEPHNSSSTAFSWEMIGLGLEEPLPPQEIMDELYQIYFSKIHQSMPILHRLRFMAALDLAPHMRPPVCLRYIMWALAASVENKYEALAEHFYQRTRKYAQMDEMKGYGEPTTTLAHCQTAILTGSYEFKQMYFPRAWLSVGRAVRLAQMMQIHRLDGEGLDVKQCLSPPRDWTEREERRRTFWMAFAMDRYASIGTGWPMTIDERDIMTNLPASEEAFETSKETATGTFDQILSPNGTANLHAMGAIVWTAAMFGRNLLHLHRPQLDDSDHDLNGGFWSRHREIEQMLLQTSLGLPDHLRLPANLGSPNVVFANMCIHTSAICLHQAAIFKADRYRLPASVGNESKIRCVTAAAEIASIMRMISHMDLAAMNPFLSFCIYVAARVFIQYLKTRPKDMHMTSSLQFLLQAMHALRRKNPLTESFLVQLDLDLESAGVQGLQQKASVPQPTKAAVAPRNQESWQCVPTVNFEPPSSTIPPTQTFDNTSKQHTSSTSYGNISPSPPLHLHNINSINMAPQPHHQTEPTSNPFISPTFDLPSTTEMEITNDRIPNPHTSSSSSSPPTANLSLPSHSASASQSSSSPEKLHTNMAFRASPTVSQAHLIHHHNSATHNASRFTDLHTACSTTTITTPTTIPTANTYTNPFTSSSILSSTAYQQVVVADDEWGFASLDANANTLSVEVDGSWGAILESVTMGWNGLEGLRSSGPGFEDAGFGGGGGGGGGGV